MKCLNTRTKWWSAIIAAVIVGSVLFIGLLLLVNGFDLLGVQQEI